jgi:hypothetical protein
VPESYLGGMLTMSGSVDRHDTCVINWDRGNGVTAPGPGYSGTSIRRRIGSWIMAKAAAIHKWLQCGRSSSICSNCVIYCYVKTLEWHELRKDHGKYSAEASDIRLSCMRTHSSPYRFEDVILDILIPAERVYHSTYISRSSFRNINSISSYWV